LEPASDRWVKNRVTRGVSGGAEYVAQDATSINLYGVVEDTDTGLLFEPEAEALLQATYLRDQWKDPQFRASRLVVRPGRAEATLFPAVLFDYLGTRVTVERTPLGAGTQISQECWIEQVTHEFDSAGFWQTTYALSEAETNTYFTLDDSTLGWLDAGYQLAY